MSRNELTRAGVARYAELLAALAVVAAVASVPLITSSTTPYALDIKRPVSGACAIVAGLALLVRWAAGGRFSAGTATMARALVFFLCAAAVSVAMSCYRGAGLREMWWYAAHAIFFLAAAVSFRRRPGLLLAAVLVAATVVAFSGWMQAHGEDVLGRTWWKHGRKIELGPGARVLGTVGLETALGGYMAACAVLAFGAVFWLERPMVRAAAATAGLMMAGCMVLTGTRSAWAAFVAGLIVLGSGLAPALRRALSGRRAKFALLIAAAAVVTALFMLAPTMVWARMKRAPADIGTRVAIWQAALGIFYDSPVAGKGPGTFTLYYADFRPPDYAARGAEPVTIWAHSEYLEVLAETGLLGMVPFALFIGFFVVGSVRSLRDGRTDARRALLAAVLAAAVTMMAHAAVNVDTRYPTCRLILWVMLGFGVALWSDEDRAPYGRPGRAGVVWRALVLAGAVATAAAVWGSQIYGPHVARVYLRRAHDCRDRGEWAESARFALMAAERDPISVPSYYTLSNALLRAGDYEGSIEVLRGLGRYSPHYADIDLRGGVANALLGRMGEARGAFDTARNYGIASPLFGRFEELSDEDLLRRAREYAAVADRR